MGKTCQNTQASNWQCDFSSGRFAPESVLSFATELIWPRPASPALTAVLSSAGSHSRCILGFPWLHCSRLSLLGWVRGFSFWGRVSLNGLSQFCCGRFKGWTAPPPPLDVSYCSCSNSRTLCLHAHLSWLSSSRGNWAYNFWESRIVSC